MNNKIYSPILKSAQEAFVYQGAYTVYFNYPQFVDKSLIKHMQIRITNQQDSKSLVLTSNFPDGIYYTTNFSAEGSIDIPFGSLVTPPRAGEIYKVQLRFGYCDLFTNLSQFTTWKTTAVQNSDFSEWSTVMAIKCISIPEMQFLNLAPGDILNTLHPELAAITQFDPQDKEYVDNYKFTILDKDQQVIADSGWCQHLEINENIDRYKFDIALKENKVYFARYSIISSNGYERSILSDFEVSDNYFTTLENVDFSIDELDTENGAIKLLVETTNDNILLGKYVISRADETSNFEKWEDLHVFFAAGVKSYNFTDYTVRDGVGYEYAIQMENPYGNRTAPTYANKADPAVIYLEHSYLVGKQGRQLKLNYNFQVSSFKHTVLASKQDTLGSKYPTILRNGIAYYAEFPISGLISVKMDDINSFAQMDSTIAPNELSYENINTERQFREQVEEFLNDGEPKLFRSATEGNFLVVLMNISLSPENVVNRALYSFSATAYEVAPVTFDKLREFGIITSEDNIPESEEEGAEFILNQLGDTCNGPQAAGFDFTAWLNNYIKTKYANENYDIELVAIKNLEIYAGDMLASLVVGSGSDITIPAYKRYYYLETIHYPTSTKITIPSKIAQINYTFDYKIIAKETINVADFGRQKVWGQVVNHANLNDASTNTMTLENFLLKDWVQSDGLIPNGQITTKSHIIKDDKEYKINKFYTLSITGAPNQTISPQFSMNNTGYYKLQDISTDELSDVTVDLSKDFIIDYHCAVDWTTRSGGGSGLELTVYSKDSTRYVFIRNSFDHGLDIQVITEE